jgi:hypothetical protein
MEVRYCPSCKKSQRIRLGRKIVVSMTNGNKRNAIRGVCYVCDGNIFAFLPEKNGKMNGAVTLWRGALSFLRRGSN